MVKRNRITGKQPEGPMAKKGKDSAALTKKKKACEKIHCPAKEPTCFAQMSEKCCGSSWTSRWYHLSEDEHYCTECLEHFYKNNRPGFTVYSLWKEHWMRDYKGDAPIRQFMSDQVLPFWVQCNKCEKWRQLPNREELTKPLIRDFTCDQIYMNAIPPCSQPEAIEAQNAVLPHWINTLTLAPMLKESPAYPLLTNYSPVSLGMTASKLEYLSIRLDERVSALERQLEEAKSNDETVCLGVFETEDYELNLIKTKLTHPFIDVGEELIALSIRPDAMEEHEKLIFSEYSKEQAMYLCLRNLIYALWMKDPTRWLTIQEVSKHLICRGLSRVRCIYEAQRVLHYFTQRGLVNHGHLIPPPELPRLPPTRVVVVGSGMSGLAAGRHLSNLGMKVTVLEASDRIGGRVHCVKNPEDGLTVSSGADRILGIINNPIAALALQCGITPKPLDESQMILHPGGTIVDPTVDETVEDLFGSAINSIIEWRQNIDLQNVAKQSQKKGTQGHLSSSEPDQDLESKFHYALDQLDVKLEGTKEELQVLESYKSLLESTCGVPLNQISAKMFVQPSFCSQFAGGPAVLPGGVGPLLEDLSCGLEVRLSTKVHTIELVTTGECRARVSFNAENDLEEDLDADYVVVAVPLQVMQKELITFNPPLMEPFTESLKLLGCGVCELVVAEFPHSFWRPSNAEHRCGLIMRTMDEQSKERGLFPFFTDVSAFDRDGIERYLLKSYIVGEAVERMSVLSDAEVEAEYVQTLTKYFGEIPEPLQCVVSRFSIDENIGMAYTYPKVGCSLEQLRPLGYPVQENTVFIAGEYLSQNFDRSLSGAYLSGLDAAARIVYRCLYGDDTPYIQSGI